MRFLLLKLEPPRVLERCGREGEAAAGLPPPCLMVLVAGWLKLIRVLPQEHTN